jgi:hypothetical protein
MIAKKDDAENPSYGSHHDGILTPVEESVPELFARLSADVIVQTFRKCGEPSNKFVQNSGLAGYSENELPKSDKPCLAHICDAFEHLGCSSGPVVQDKS